MNKSEKTKRDTLSLHLKPLAALLSETLEEQQRNPSATSRSLESFSENKEVDRVEQEGQEEEEEECKIYYETICTGEAEVFDSSCERIPVRLCADGCRIQEGDTECEK